MDSFNVSKVCHQFIVQLKHWKHVLKAEGLLNKTVREIDCTCTMNYNINIGCDKGFKE